MEKNSYWTDISTLAESFSMLFVDFVIFKSDAILLIMHVFDHDHTPTSICVRLGMF